MRERGAEREETNRCTLDLVGQRYPNAGPNDEARILTLGRALIEFSEAVFEAESGGQVLHDLVRNSAPVVFGWPPVGPPDVIVRKSPDRRIEARFKNGLLPLGGIAAFGREEEPRAQNDAIGAHGEKRGDLGTAGYTTGCHNKRSSRRHCKENGLQQTEKRRRLGTAMTASFVAWIDASVNCVGENQ